MAFAVNSKLQGVAAQDTDCAMGFCSACFSLRKKPGFGVRIKFWKLGVRFSGL